MTLKRVVSLLRLHPYFIHCQNCLCSENDYKVRAKHLREYIVELTEMCFFFVSQIVNFRMFLVHCKVSPWSICKNSCDPFN